MERCTATHSHQVRQQPAPITPSQCHHWHQLGVVIYKGASSFRLRRPSRASQKQTDEHRSGARVFGHRERSPMHNISGQIIGLPRHSPSLTGRMCILILHPIHTSRCSCIHGTMHPPHTIPDHPCHRPMNVGKPLCMVMRPLQGLT
jgi:hypothetical protein